VNMEKYIKTDSDFHNIVEARSLGVGRALLKAAELKRDEKRSQNERSPQLCDEDIRKDIRYNLGFVAALNWIMELPQQAKIYISKLPTKEV